MIVDVLISACLHTVENKLIQFAKVDSSYRFLLYAGHLISETGNWLLQDGTLSFQSFMKVFSAGCGGTGPIDVVCHSEDNWPSIVHTKSAKRIRLIAEKCAITERGAEESGFTKFASSVASYITVEATQQLLQGTDVIGVVPFSRPTANIFQGGNGMSAMFGVRGFSMLVDVGFPRRTCCWDFVRHMDRIDVMILPQIGETNVLGAWSFAERLAVGDVRTAVGQVFINARKAPAAGKISSSGAATDIHSAEEQSNSLPLSVNKIGMSVIECLEKADILCAPCVTKAPSQAVNLYHKVGFGSLDMYVLNPVADSDKDLKELLAEFGKTSKFFNDSKWNDFMSASILVVFKPQKPGDHPVRILFPGSSQVMQLYKSLDSLKTNPLFRTEDGVTRTTAQKSAGDKGAARLSTGTSKSGPAPARPASTSASARDSHSSKAVTKTSGKTVVGRSSISAADLKKTSSESAAVKSRDQKTTLRDAKPDVKSDAAKQKDATAHPPTTTSTPKKESQKTSAPKSDASATKGGSALSANKTQAKVMPSPIRQTTQSPRQNNEISADVPALMEVPAKYPVADKPDVKQDDVTASDDQADVIPQLVLCATEQDKPSESVADLQQQGDDHLMAGASETARTVNGSEENVANVEEKVADTEEKVASAEALAAAELAADQTPQAGVEVDPVQLWEAPQGLPAPADDKGAGKLAPKDRASATAGKRTDRPTNPPSSARPASSATGGSKKAPPLRAMSPPFYVDLAYVPTYAINGCDAEFFRRVRSRHYVIPGSSADPHLLSMLADAKSAWDGEVVVIPTGNTDALIRWVMAHHEELAALKIEVKPSVARSTLQLDRGSTCSAYRLEF